MRVVFVHGWSVTNTDTYGALPQYLKQQSVAGKLDVTVDEVLLGKYVSFEDTVSVDDIARAFDAALRDRPALAAVFNGRERFACITHSTGGPVVRQWIRRFYGRNLATSPISHLIMLAPANHGSALAQLGKSRLARIKTFFEGVEPGRRVLDWLELGSDQSWTLNEEWLDYDCVKSGVYPFVLQGQSIDRKLYDVLNTYTDEMGSDGVVRVAAANMNYALVSLAEKDEKLSFDDLRRSGRTALAILPDLAHSGESMGIIRSVTLDGAAEHPTTIAVLKCLAVDSAAAYARLADAFDASSAKTQDAEVTRRAKIGPFHRTFKTHRCSMLVFRLFDDTGLPLTDYDLLFTAGAAYDENHLPPGFFVDKQRNQLNPGKLTFFLDFDVLSEGLSDKLQNRLGLKLTARPAQGLARYGAVSFEGTGADIVKAIRPNETLMVEIIVRRRIDRRVFTLTDQIAKPESIDGKPSGTILPPPA
jgi:hypothetical protein